MDYSKHWKSGDFSGLFVINNVNNMCQILGWFKNEGLTNNIYNGKCEANKNMGYFKNKTKNVWEYVVHNSTCM